MLSYPNYVPTMITGTPMMPSNSYLLLYGRKIMKEDDISTNEIPMTGEIYYFPFSDGSKIITKQWKSDGSLETKCYILKDQSKPEMGVTLDTLANRVSNLEKSVFGKKPFRKRINNEYDGVCNQVGEEQSEIQKQSDSSTLSGSNNE